MPRPKWKSALFRPILAFLLLLGCAGMARADVFTVTTIADGPNIDFTLRWALTMAAANGTATPDEIRFNIDGPATDLYSITLRSALPALSSNLTIDGTTQVGRAWGKSDAKIRIELPSGTMIGLRGFKVDNVNIYGLFIDKPAINAGIDDVENAAETAPAGIQVRNSKNIRIGGAGKGNMVRNMLRDIDVGYEFTNVFNDILDESLLSENITIANNIVGLHLDGSSNIEMGKGQIYASRVRDLVIQDNIVAGKITYYDQASGATYRLGKLLINGNRIGLNVAGTAAVEPSPYTGAKVDECVNVSAELLDECEISHNVLAGRSIGINITVSCFFKIQSNKIGTDKDGVTAIGMAHSAIIVGNCRAGGIIGGPTAELGNLVEGCFAHLYNGYESVGVIQNLASANIELAHNSFRCNNNRYTYQAGTSISGVPAISVTSRDQNTIRGTATPGSRIDLFYSKGCRNCEPEEFITSVIADANGNWGYTNQASLQAYNIIGSATVAATTSEFSSIKADYSPSSLVIRMVCGADKGAISGIRYKNAQGYAWYKNGVQVGASPDIADLDPGTYYLVVTDGYCNTQTDYYEIKDVTVTADFAGQVVRPATCGNSDGSITGIVSNGNNFVWKNSSGATVATSTTSADLRNMPAGLYTLTASTTGYCSKTFTPVQIGVPGNPVVDESSKVVTSARCNTANGAITGLRVTGTGPYTYKWFNADRSTIVVGTTLDLTGVSAGNYLLQVTGGDICGAIASTTITIDDSNGITIDERAAVVSSAACVGPGGTIKGIRQTGATALQWVYAATNQPVPGQTFIDLLDVQPGSYKLVASNATCTKQSTVFTVTRSAGTTFPDYRTVAIDPSCGNNSGSIEVIFSGGLRPRSARWVDGAGVTRGTSTFISNLDAGLYQLYLTDAQGCENLYRTFTLTRVEPLLMNTGAQIITPDQCGAGKGAVANIVLSGGRPPYTTSWTDAAGAQLSATTELDHVKPGLYFFHATDAFGGPCNVINVSYEVRDRQNALTLPALADVQICAAGDVRIAVPRPSPGTYRLYDAPAATVPIRENTTGVFSVKVAIDTRFYVEYVSGTCSSARVPVNVTISDKGFRVAGSFTPNNDGMNDTWTIASIENYPEAEIRVFNRLGNVVFKSTGYSKPFDGRSGDTELPSGTYYYLIDLHSNCKPMSGSLTLIR